MKNLQQNSDLYIVSIAPMYVHYTSHKSFNGQQIYLSVNKMTGEVIFDYKSVLKALDVKFDPANDMPQEQRVTSIQESMERVEMIEKSREV